jgi:hypothetical protein
MAKKNQPNMFFIAIAVLAIVIAIYISFSDNKQSELKETMSIYNVGNISKVINKTIINVIAEYSGLPDGAAPQLVYAYPQQLYLACNRTIAAQVAVSGAITHVQCQLNSQDMFSVLNTVSPWFIEITYQDNGTLVDPIFSNIRAVEVDGDGCTATDCTQYKIVSMVVQNQ